MTELELDRLCELQTDCGCKCMQCPLFARYRASELGLDEMKKIELWAVKSKNSDFIGLSEEKPTYDKSIGYIGLKNRGFLWLPDATEFIKPKKITITIED